MPWIMGSSDHTVRYGIFALDDMGKVIATCMELTNSNSYAFTTTT